MLMALKKSKHIHFLMELAGPGYVQESIRGEKCAQQKELRTLSMISNKSALKYIKTESK